MGVLSFISEMQRNNSIKQQAELDRKSRLAEIAAQGQNQIAVLERSNKLAEQQRKEQEMEKLQSSALDKDKYLTSRIENLLATGKAPADAGAQASQEWNSMQTEPAYVPTSSAMAKNEFNRGLTPLMGALGKTSTQADIMGAKARESEGFNQYNTNVERGVTMPLAATAQDRATTAEANQRATSAMTTIPGLAKVIPAQQDAMTAEANMNAAKAAQESKVLPLLSAPAEAEARNNNNLATSASAGLVQRSGGLFTPGVGNQAIGNYMLPPALQGVLQQLLTSSLTNRNAAPTTPTTVPVRTPINLKNLGITLPME